jgi:hypothetical protein
VLLLLKSKAKLLVMMAFPAVLLPVKFRKPTRVLVMAGLPPMMPTPLKVRA